MAIFNSKLLNYQRVVLGEGETTKAWNSYNSRYSGGRSGSGGGAGYGGYSDYSGNGYENGSGIALLEGMLKFTLMNLTSGKSAMCFLGIFLPGESMVVTDLC